MSMDGGCACMRRIILVLLALVFLVTGCVQIGNQPAAKDKRRAVPVVDGDAAISHIERDMRARELTDKPVRTECKAADTYQAKRA